MFAIHQYFSEIRIWSHRTIKVNAIMVPLIIITVSEIHHALTGSNFSVLYFDG
jgi:hypothetical protein